MRYYAGLCTKPSGQTYAMPDPNVQAMTVREPIGVVGLIVAWNFPISLAIWKLAPALAAGNTVVLKPASATPLSAVLMVEMLAHAGFPKGVVNLVLGSGSDVGDELARNPDVEKVAFTGSIEAGRSVMCAASENMKGICLELGGKSPVVIFDDADFETAVDYAAFGIFYNQGEVCSAGSRVLVQDTIYDRFVEALLAETKKIRLGNGLDEGVTMGPLVTKAHMETVLHYIEIGKQEGATLLCGGRRGHRRESFGRLFCGADDFRRLHAGDDDCQRGNFRACFMPAEILDGTRGRRARERHDIRSSRRRLYKRRRKGAARDPQIARGYYVD